MSDVDQTPELLALLQACKETPDDHSPRLVLADWLEDHGLTGRAEGVRLSCQLERLPEVDPRRELGRAVLDDPRGELGRWLAPLRERFRGADLHGGLIRIPATPAQLLGLSPDELPADYLPWLETLRLRGFTTPFQVVLLARRGWLRPFTVLDLDQTGLGDGAFQALFEDAPATGHLAHLAGLGFAYNHLTAEGVRAFAQAEGQLPALRRLTLDTNRQVGDGGAGALAGSTLLGRLTSLSLHHNALTPAGVAALASSRHAGNLVHLNLGLNALGGEGVQALARSRRLGRLRSLALSACYLGERDLEALGQWPADRPLDRLDLSTNERADPAGWLARSPLAGTIRDLDLSATGLQAESVRALLDALPGPRLERLSLGRHKEGDAACVALARCAALAHLRALDLSNAGVGPRGLLELARSPHLRDLEVLGLYSNRLGPEGFGALTRGTLGSRKGAGEPIDPFPALRALDLGHTRPKRQGIEALAGSPLMRRLQVLSLAKNRLGPAGVAALVGSPAVANLEHLNLLTCSLGDEGIEALVRSAHLGGLRSLVLADNRVGDAGAKALARSRRFAGLTSLALHVNRITDEGGKELLGWKRGDWALFDVRHNRLGTSMHNALTGRATRSG